MDPWGKRGTQCFTWNSQSFQWFCDKRGLGPGEPPGLGSAPDMGSWYWYCSVGSSFAMAKKCLLRLFGMQASCHDLQMPQMTENHVFHADFGPNWQKVVFRKLSSSPLPQRAWISIYLLELVWSAWLVYQLWLDQCKNLYHFIMLPRGKIILRSQHLVKFSKSTIPHDYSPNWWNERPSF
jgi:hypothetical protein